MSYQTEWQAKKKAREECACCGTTVGENNPHTGYAFTLCRPCRVRQAARQKAKYSARAITKCKKCSGTPEDGRKYCPACLERKHAINALRAVKGICLICPNPVLGTSSRCAACLEKMRSHMKRRYDAIRRRRRGGLSAVPVLPVQHDGQGVAS